MPAHVGGDDVAHRQKRRAAVVVDHTLRVAGRPGGVIQRDGVPLVEREGALVSLVAPGDEGLVLDLPDALARSVVFRIVVVDHERTDFCELQRFRDDLRELAVDKERLRLAVVEHEGEGCGVEAGVEGVEHGAAHRDAVVAFEHRRRVGEQRRDRVAPDEPALRQRRGEFFRAGVELAVGPAQGSVRDRQTVREDLRRALEIVQRGQRLEIRGVAIEIAFIGRLGHRIPLLGPPPGPR